MRIGPPCTLPKSNDSLLFIYLFPLSISLPSLQKRAQPVHASRTFVLLYLLHGKTWWVDVQDGLCIVKSSCSLFFSFSHHQVKILHNSILSDFFTHLCQEMHPKHPFFYSVHLAWSVAIHAHALHAYALPYMHMAIHAHAHHLTMHAYAHSCIWALVLCHAHAIAFQWP